MRKIGCLFLFWMILLVGTLQGEVPQKDAGTILEIDLAQYDSGKTYTIFTGAGKISELNLVNTYAFFKYSLHHRIVAVPPALKAPEISALSFGKSLPGWSEEDVAVFEQLQSEFLSIIQSKLNVFYKLKQLNNNYQAFFSDENVEQVIASSRHEIKNSFSEAKKIYETLKPQINSESILNWLLSKCNENETKSIEDFIAFVKKDPRTLLDFKIKMDELVQFVSSTYELSKEIDESEIRKWTINADLSENDYMILEIERIPEQKGAEKAQWKFVIDSCKQKAYWLTSYGFSFAYPISREFDYYCKKNESGDGFRIASKRNRDLKAFPTIFFTYLPYSYRFRALNLGLSAGIGLNDKVAVFLAGTLNVYTNISIHLGCAIQGVDKLLPKYNLEDVLKDSLDSDQLVKKGFGVSAFISVSFRFDSNPFKGSEKKAEVKQTSEKK